MLKLWLILLAFLTPGIAVFSQDRPADSTISPTDLTSVIDTTLDYETLFSDFEMFMDSLLQPRSYLMGSISAAKGYYNFEGKGTSTISAVQKLTYNPAVSYFHKTGLGLTTTGYLVDDDVNLNFFQFSITPSFDYIQNRNFVTGFSFTRFFTRDSLPFYTTPLQNELYLYFSYRKSWIKPTLAASYGWGSRTDYKKRYSLIQDLRLRRNGFTYINTTESVSDFSLVTSVRHDFYWLDIFTSKDHVRFTPQVSFTSGTQKFGFNQSSNTYATVLRTGNNVLFNTDNIYLDDKIHFQPLSLSLFLRGEYSIGKFFIQPVWMLDYYFPAPSEKLSSLFTISAGMIL